jgi:hypothetical protein
MLKDQGFLLPIWNPIYLSILFILFLANNWLLNVNNRAKFI